MSLISKLIRKINECKSYNPLASKYKFDTLEHVKNIPVPTKPFKTDLGTNSIEYVLQRKATEYKKAGDLNLAIECLRKSIQIMQFCPCEYSEQCYIRLEEYLKQARRFDEARIAEEKRKNFFNSQRLKHLEYEIAELRTYDSIIVPRCDDQNPLCSECAKYHDRIYAKNGENGFPDIDIFINYYASRDCDCFLWYYCYFGDSDKEITLSHKNNLIKYSNRPFKDDRTKKEKELFNNWLNKKNADLAERKEYDWFRENFPDIAPGSLSGYKNMKHRNSKNYQKLLVVAQENGFLIK